MRPTEQTKQGRGNASSFDRENVFAKMSGPSRAPRSEPGCRTLIDHIPGPLALERPTPLSAVELTVLCYWSVFAQNDDGS